MKNVSRKIRKDVRRHVLFNMQGFVYFSVDIINFDLREKISRKFELNFGIR